MYRYTVYMWCECGVNRRLCARIGLTAAVCASCIIYIFPGLAYYKLINSEPVVGMRGEDEDEAAAAAGGGVGVCGVGGVGGGVGGDGGVGVGVSGGVGGDDDDVGGTGGGAGKKGAEGVMRRAIFPWMLVLLGCFTMVAGTIANVVDAVRGRDGPGGR